MKLAGKTKGLVVGLAVLGLCLPQPLLAAAPTDPAPVIANVQLHQGPEGSVLLGQVVDPQGPVKANVPVLLRGEKQRVVVGKTDANGHFAFRGLRGGLYQVMAAGGHAVYRVWTPGTAPPSAQSRVLVVADKDTALGQLGYNGRLRQWLSKPWVIGLIVATAVAVPVAVHNLDDDGPSSP